MKLSKRIREWMLKQNKVPVDVASLSGVSLTTVIRILRGHEPSSAIEKLITQVLDKPSNDTTGQSA
jgi:transcriptional regulator with XRE-family HTH domain